MTITDRTDTDYSVEAVDNPLTRIRTADGMFAVDAKQRIVSWSDSAEEMLGYTADEVLGKFCFEVAGGKDERNFRFCRKDCPVITNARRGRTTPNYDILTKTKDEESIWINMSILVTENGENGRQAVHLFRDVTKRRQTEEQSRRATAALRAVLDSPEDGGLTDEVPAATPRPQLSPREMEVLRLLAHGMSNKEIAEALLISPITARNHVDRLMSKLGVRSRLEAVVYASQKHLL